jgi:hypothetical protein
MTRSRSYGQPQYAIGAPAPLHNRTAPSVKLNVTISAALGGTLSAAALTVQTTVPTSVPWTWVTIIVILIIVIVGLIRRPVSRRYVTFTKTKYSLRVSQRSRTRGSAA